MDRRHGDRLGGHGKKVTRWRSFPGGVDSDGEPVVKPLEVEQAEVIIRLCERFHVLPSELLDEPVDLLRLITLADLGDTEGGD
jgi:hypothetical protein